MYYYTPAVSSLMNSETFWIFWLSEREETWPFWCWCKGNLLQVLSGFLFHLFLVKSVVSKCSLSVASWCLEFFLPVRVCGYNLLYDERSHKKYLSLFSITIICVTIRGYIYNLWPLNKILGGEQRILAFQICSLSLHPMPLFLCFPSSWFYKVEE